EEPEVAAKDRVILAKTIGRLVREREHRARVGDETMPRLREPRAVRVAQKQRGAGAVLQRAQVPTQRWLRELQRTRRGRDRSALDDAEEGAQEVEIVEGGHPFSE